MSDLRILSKAGVLPDLKWHKIDGSSTIRAIAYRGKTKELWIQFTSGAIYRYEGVPLQVMGALMRARSKGRAHNRLVKARSYVYHRLG